MREHGREIGPDALQVADIASSGDGRASYAVAGRSAARTDTNLPGSDAHVIIKGLPGT